MPYADICQQSKKIDEHPLSGLAFEQECIITSCVEGRYPLAGDDILQSSSDAAWHVKLEADLMSRTRPNLGSTS